jgi:hypothetical protein
VSERRREIFDEIEADPSDPLSLRECCPSCGDPGGPCEAHLTAREEGAVSFICSRDDAGAIFCDETEERTCSCALCSCTTILEPWADGERCPGCKEACLS